MVYLRVQLLGVQTQEPWRYYVAFQLLEPGSSAATAHVQAAGAAPPPDVVCRTNTASPSRTPEFSSRTFLLRLPAAAAGQSSGYGSTHAAASSSTPATKLAVSLFAAPSVNAPAGPIIAGREVDRLVASAVLDLEQQLLQRLGAGEHVAVPVLLRESPDCRVQQMPEGMGSQAAQLQGMRSSQQVPNTSRSHVLLELVLLHADIPGGLSTSTQSLYQQATAGNVNHSMVLGSSYASRQDDSMFPPAAAALTAAGEAGASSDGDVELLVLVSAASNVPLVPGPEGQLEPPSVTVALRAGVDGSKGQAHASTGAAAASCNPFWGELLSVKGREAQLSHSRLYISLLSSTSNRALAKGSLKLSGLLPGQHYSLALALTDTCTLYVTVVLGLGGQTLLEALQGSGLAAAAAESDGRLQLLQAALPHLEGPLQIPLADPSLLQGAGYEVWAVWRSADDSKQQQQQQEQHQQPVYIQLDAREGSEAGSAASLRVYNSNIGLLAVGAPSRAGSASSSRGVAPAAEADGRALKGVGGVLAVVPLLTSQVELEWPQEHQVLLPLLMAQQTAASLELYLQSYPGSSSSKGGRSKLPAPVCFARTALPLAAIAGQKPGSPFELPLQLGFNINLAAAASTAGKMQASIQVTIWDVQRYLTHLIEIARQQEQQRQLQQRQQQQVPALISSPSPIPPPLGVSTTKGIKSAAAAAATWMTHQLGASIAQQQQQQQGGTVELLVGDLIAKQQALERLQRQLDLVAQCAEVSGGRIAELQAANSNLSADLQHLRQLLHEEKEASSAASSLLDTSQPHLLPGTHIALETSTREQVLQQLTIVLGKHATERARNGELVRRLQQLHAEKVDVMELQRQYLELQEAHFQQSKLLVDQDTHQHTLATLKKAVSDQEALITRMQQLLAAAAGRNKELEVWKSSANTLQQEVNRLREELSEVASAGAAAEQQAAAQAAAAALAESEAAARRVEETFDAQLMVKESERLSAVMRAERAETSAVAAQNELLDVTKRYAREIAQLKTKLAEKDAQLLGGFGSIAHLTLGPFDSHTAAAVDDFGAFTQAGLTLGAFGGLPALHKLGLPGTAVAGAAPTAAPPAAAGQLGSHSRVASGSNSGSPSAAAVSGGAPKSPDALARNRSRSQHAYPNPLAAAAASGTAVDDDGGSGSGRGFGQQVSYTLRAGSAEARLMRPSPGGSQRQGPGTAGRSSKPGSPLLPTSQQQRLTNSADGVRGPGPAAMDGSFGRGSPSQQQHDRRTRELGSPQQAWGPGSPHQEQQYGAQQQWQQPQQQQQQQYGAQQEQQRQVQQQQFEALQSQPLAGDEYEDEYEGDDGEEEMQQDGREERQTKYTHGQQQQQQQSAPLPASPKKRGGLAGFFNRG